MEVELLKALPGGGSLVVCVALVILFLKHMREVHEANTTKTAEAIKEMTERFNAEHAETREAYQGQMKSITDKVFDIANSTTQAIKGLEIAVRELQQKIH